MGEEVGFVGRIVRGPEAPLLAVTDTHALIWAIDGNRKRLGKHARKMFDNADEAKCAIYVPALALAELGEACHKDRVTLALPFEEWARAAFASGKYQEAELTAEIVYVAQRLYAISGTCRPPDRGDRRRTGPSTNHPRSADRGGSRG